MPPMPMQQAHTRAESRPSPGHSPPQAAEARQGPRPLLLITSRADAERGEAAGPVGRGEGRQSVHREQHLIMAPEQSDDATPEEEAAGRREEELGVGAVAGSGAQDSWEEEEEGRLRREAAALLKVRLPRASTAPLIPHPLRPAGTVKVRFGDTQLVKFVL